MASDTDTGPQPSCSAFIKHGARRLRRRTSASKARQPEVTGPDGDDYGFLGDRLPSGQQSSPSSAHPRAPPRRRREQVYHGGADARGGGGDNDRGRRASTDGGSVASSSASIPITLGSLAASGDAGASSQRCSIDEIERRPPSACSRPDSPWSEMSIHLASERLRPSASTRAPQQQQQPQSRCFGLAAVAAAETIGKYRCHQGRSRSAGPPMTRLRGGGAADGRASDMSFYAHVRHTREAAATPAATGGNRSKSECRSSARRSAVPGASASSSSAAGGGASWVRPSRSASRRQRCGDREQAAPAEEVRRPRSSSKSRDIFALYTRSATPAAAAEAPSARSQSCPRRADSAASSVASTLVAAAGCWQLPQSTARGRRSKSAAPPRWRVTGASEATAADAAAAAAAAASAASDGRRRSRSQPRLQQSGRADSTIGGCAGGGSSRTDSVLSSRDDSLSESLRTWAAARTSASRRSSLSTTPRSRRDSGQSSRRRGDSDADGQPASRSFVAVLEMDKDVNARVEETLNNGNSLRPADVPLMAIAGYRPADDSWTSGDEVRVEAGSVVLAKYKQCEWVYVRTPDGGEGFMPYAYTKPIKVDAAASGPASAAAAASFAGPRPTRRGPAASATAARAPATPASPPASNQTRPTPRPRPSPRVRCAAAGGRPESSPCPSLAVSSVDSARGWPAEAPSPAFRQGTDAPSHVERIWQRVWDVTTAPGGGYAASSRLQTARGDWLRAADALSVASSDGDSVFYEATLAAFDADTLSASGSEVVQRARSTAAAAAAECSASSRESTPVMTAAAGHCTDYYSNAAFFSDSGISEPCSERGDADDPPRRFRSAAAAAPPAKVSARFIIDGCGATAAAARTAAPHPGGERHGADRAAVGGGRRRRGSDGHRLRPSSDALDRARTAADARADGRGGAAAAYRSLCPELTRDYGGPAATVVYDYDAENEDDVGARAGDSVCVLNEDDPQWLWVQKRDGSEGFLPRDNVLFLPFKPNVRPEDRRLMTTVLAAV